jgi:hypothetical protein
MLARPVILAQKNSPTLLFAGGVALAIGSTVMACRATLRVESELTLIENKIKEHKAGRLRHSTEVYSTSAYNKDMLFIYMEATAQMARLYAPAIGLGLLSLGMFAGSHSILMKRNAGLTAALTLTTEAFNDYRARVIADVGADKDREYRFGATDKTIVEDTDEGPVTKNVKVAGDGNRKPYAVIFDRSNANWQQQSSYNVMFLRTVQLYCNDKLRAKGHLFLNEVYRELGMPDTKAGAVTGWIFDPRNPERHTGDGFVDFQVFRNHELNQFHEMVVGPEGEIFLDFNVDGPIWNKI